MYERISVYRFCPCNEEKQLHNLIYRLQYTFNCSISGQSSFQSTYDWRHESLVIWSHLYTKNNFLDSLPSTSGAIPSRRLSISADTPSSSRGNFQVSVIESSLPTLQRGCFPMHLYWVQPSIQHTTHPFVSRNGSIPEESFSRNFSWKLRFYFSDHCRRISKTPIRCSSI